MFTGPRDAAVNNTADRTWGPISPVNASEHRGYAVHNFRLPIENLPNAVLIAGGTGSVLAANGAAERIFGYGPGQLVGQPFERLVPGWSPRLTAEPWKAIPVVRRAQRRIGRAARCRYRALSSMGQYATSSLTSVRQAMA